MSPMKPATKAPRTGRGMKAARRFLRTTISAALGAGTVLSPAYAQLSSALVAAAYDAATPPPTSNVVDADKASSSTKTMPAFRPLTIPSPEFTDWWKPYADDLDAGYDKWLTVKKSISNQFNLDLSLDYSLFLQWGTKSQPIYLNIYYPSATWRPFTGTPIGSGEIDIVTSHQDYASNQNAISQAARLGLITFANDWTYDDFAISTLAYTHTLPGRWSSAMRRAIPSASRTPRRCTGATSRIAPCTASKPSTSRNKRDIPV